MTDIQAETETEIETEREKEREKRDPAEKEPIKLGRKSLMVFSNVQKLA